jgi:hypothetical protein
MDLKYLLKIFIVFILIFSVIVFINLIGLNFNEPKTPKVLLGSATIEGLEPKILSGNDAFCESHKGFDLETSCNNLTNYNCNSTSCCVWTSDNKCKAGTASGPTFNSDENGKTKKLDYYYFQNKCYGSGCP